jgi:hypothetical protein
LRNLKLLIPACILLVIGGFTVTCLWNWFVVPPFGAPTLSFAQATGCYLLFSLTQIKASTEIEKPGNEQCPEQASKEAEAMLMAEFWVLLKATLMIFGFGATLKLLQMLHLIH